MVTTFYKGVGVGTHHHSMDWRLSGVPPRSPGSPANGASAERHIAFGTTISPYVSLTKSYGVARDYAVNGSISRPTLARPAHVYEFQIPDVSSIPVLDAVS